MKGISKPAQHPLPSFYPQTAQLRRLFDLSPDVLCLIDRSGNFVSINSACHEAWGYEPGELEGISSLALVHPQDREATEKFAADIHEGSSITGFRNRFLHKDGRFVHMEWSASFDDTEGLMFCIGRKLRQEGRDATHLAQEALIVRLKQTEEELRRTNERFRLAARTDAIYEWNILSNDLQWGEGLFEIFGYQPDDFQMPAWEAALYPGEAPRLLQQLYATLADPAASNWEVEYRIRDKQGNTRLVFEKGYIQRDASGKAVRMVGRMQDITSRRRYEDERQKLSLIARETSNAVSLLDAEFRVTWINPAFTKIYGFTSEEAIGHHYLELIGAPDNAAAGQFRNEMMELREYRGEFWSNAKDGRRIYTDLNAQPVLAQDGSLHYYFVLARDLTRRVEREEEFLRLSLITQQTDDGIIVTDADKKTTWINDGFTRMTGYTLEDMRGKRPAHVLEGPTPDPAILVGIEKQYTSGKPFSLEVLNYKKDGSPFWSLLSIQPLFDAEGNIVEYFSIRKDITARKQLERELEAERNKTTAAVIAAQEQERSVVSQELHDNVNQVLTTVKLYQELCLSGIGDRQELARRSMELLQETISEIRSLSKRLSAPSLGKIRLHESIRELTDAVAATGKTDVKLDTTPIESLEVDSTTHLALYRILQEQLTNVLKHAQAEVVRINFQVLPQAILMEVSDNGVGFDTTKRSNGNGLTNIRSRAESMQGLALWRSAPGLGCTLIVKIPRF